MNSFLDIQLLDSLINVAHRLAIHTELIPSR